MWKWLIGPILVATGCIAGSVYGRNAQQMVHKGPGDTYAAVERALDNVPESGTTFFDGGTPMPYALKIDREYDQKLLVTLSFAGKEGANAEIDFTPQDGGKSTMVTARIHGDHSVLSSALSGTSKARLAFAPDWMLNLAARPTLRQLAEQIEQGFTAEIVQPMTEADAESHWEQNLSSDQREDLQQYREYEASRPMTDPNADAANYMASH